MEAKTSGERPARSVRWLGYYLLLETARSVPPVTSEPGARRVTCRRCEWSSPGGDTALSELVVRPTVARLTSSYGHVTRPRLTSRTRRVIYCRSVTDNYVYRYNNSRASLFLHLTDHPPVIVWYRLAMSPPLAFNNLSALYLSCALGSGTTNWCTEGRTEFDKLTSTALH